MTICMVGTGYVGLVTGTCFAEFGNDVICVDKDEIKISKLEKGILPIYEPGLDDLVEKNVKDQKMTKTISAARIDTAADIIIRNKLFEFPLFLVRASIIINLRF